MAGTIIADSVEAAATGQLVIKNGIASAPPQFQDGAGTQIGTLCRAWVNFNGTGTVAIRESFNVSSITDNGTCDYTVNFINAMPDVNYCITGASSIASAYPGPVTAKNTSEMTTSSCRVWALTVASGGVGQLADGQIVNVAVFR